MTTSTPWFTQPTSGGSAQLRLFCFPYAGGGANLYRPWPQLVPSTIDVCPAHLPGRERRFGEQAYSQLPPLITDLALAIEGYLDRPFAFFGHSMGAIIGFELARELRRRGKAQPTHLFVSGHRGPHLPDPDPPFHNLPLAQLKSELRRLDGTPPEVLDDPEIMELMLPLLRADFELSETYHYTEDEPLSCPITVFGGDADPKARHEELEGWREHTTGSCTIRTFPGHHFYIHETARDVVRAIVQELAPNLQRVG